MFRGLRSHRLRFTFVHHSSDAFVSNGSPVLSLQFSQTNTAMAAANGVAGATAKTLKMENARGLLNLKGCG